MYIKFLNFYICDFIFIVKYIQFYYNLRKGEMFVILIVEILPITFFFFFSYYFLLGSILESSQDSIIPSTTFYSLSHLKKKLYWTGQKVRSGFVHNILQHLMEKPQRTFWPTPIE